MKPSFTIVIFLILWASEKIASLNERKTLADISRDVALKYMRAINRPVDNVAFSPSTLVQLYSIVYGAAEGQLKRELNGQIFSNWSDAEITNAMAQYSNLILTKINKGSNVRFLSGNKIFYQADKNEPGGLLPSRDLNFATDQTFESNLEKADFARNPDFQRSIIDRWIRDQTDGLIKDLFKSEEITEEIVMILASGAVLDGDFTYGFSNKSTGPRLFFPNGNSANLVQGMTVTCSRYYYGETNDATVVGMPFGLREQIVVYFIMPRRQYALSDLERNFNDDEHLLAELIENAIDYSKVVTVTMPRFKLNPEAHDTRVAFMLMGTTTMFANGFVDFSKINNRKNLYVSAAKHRAFFQVKEGTARLCPTDDDSGLARVDVNFNQPFLVIAMEKATKSILLYGRVSSTL